MPGKFRLPRLRELRGVVRISAKNSAPEGNHYGKEYVGLVLVLVFAALLLSFEA
jgi:hypothetical protein